MIKEHPYVGNDITDELSIWKYFSMDKFEWLFENEKLFFCRVDEFEDKNEFLPSDLLAKQFRMAQPVFEREMIRIREHCYVNCWSISDTISPEMWKKYAGNGTGVAIRSTIGNLKNSYWGDRNITIGKVRYVDNSTETPQPQGEKLNFLYVVFAKRKEYEQEKELRLFFEVPKSSENYMAIDINLNNLIKEIYISSDLPIDKKEHIKKILARNGIKPDKLVLLPVGASQKI